MRKFLKVFFLVSVLGIRAANAEGFAPPTDVELTRLPSFCTVKMREQRGDRDALQMGVSMIGSQFQNAHHYCFGLNFLNRYYSASFGPKAKSNLASAKNELDYMVNHLYKDSSLAGESYLYRGIVNSLMKNDTEALADLQQAVSRSPRLTRAHLALADHYSERKQRAKALEAVTEGLRHAPDSKGLKLRYQELGGKLPYPEPIAAQPEPEKKEDKPTEKPAVADAAAGAPTPQAQAGSAPVQAATADKSVGKETLPARPSKNPWCRFCPDE